MAKSVLVFGASGLLGSTLSPLLERAGFLVIRQGRDNDADIICNPVETKSVKAILNECHPSVIINLVANSNVDFCEGHISEAYLANARPVEILVAEIQKMSPKPHLIHISTDHVYGAIGPHSELTVLPKNVYALTKLYGEEIALKAGATVLRTNFFGRSKTVKRASFTDWLYQSLISGQPFTVFEDVFFSALNMKDLSAFIITVAHMKISGVFNVGSRKGLSKAKTAELFASNLGLDPLNMSKGSIKDKLLPAQRPLDMRMDSTAFEVAFSLRVPDMVDQVYDAAKDYRSLKL